MSRTKQEFFTMVRENVGGQTYEKVIIALRSFILGFLLARAGIFGGSSPFGVAYLAAIDFKSFNGFFALSGVIAGYLIDGVLSIRYILVSIAFYSLKMILIKKEYPTNLTFNAFGCASMLIISGLIEATQFNLIFYDMLIIVATAIISATFVYFFAKAIPFFTNPSARSGGLSERELISIVISMSVLFLSLNAINIGGVSIGRTAGIFIVLTASLYGGMAHGSMAGVIVGLIMSFGTGASTHIIGTYAFGGLLAGVVSDMGKLGVSVAFVLANAVLTMYFNGSSEILISLYEIMLSSIIFLIVPEKFLKKTASYILLYKLDQKAQPEKFKALFINRLKSAANSFSSLSETIKAVGTLKRSVSKIDVTPIIGKVADTICKKCRSSMFCWGASYNDTMNVLNDMSTVFSKNGKIEIKDFPSYFAVRCEKKEAIASELNLRFSEYWAKEREDIKTEENRVILAEQYSGVSQIIDNMANDLNKADRFDNIAEERIANYLIRQNIRKPNVSCYTDADGLLTVEASAVIPVEISDLSKFTNDISTLVGTVVDVNYMNEEGGIWQTKFTEREEYTISCARASCGKDGKTVCGDTSSAFRAEGGKYIMTISDGMGSGKEAERDSMLTVSFLEKLLKAGFDKESALKLVNSALILKSPDESFATVDITVINLVTGKAEFIKAGAAPTYVKRGNSVYELGCSSLPAGIVVDARFEKSKCKLKENDMIIMASDGVTAVGSRILSKIATDYKGNSPTELAELILNEANKVSLNSDDMTVAVGLFSRK